MNNSHENYTSRIHTPDIGSSRAFGITFGVIFLALGALALYHSKSSALFALPAGGAFMALAFLKPEALKPLNVLWFKFGLLLHKLINPIIMGILFFLVITPMALLCRIIRKDLLKIKPSTDKKSYWVERTEQSQFKNQF